MDYATTAINQGYAAQGAALGQIKGVEAPRTIASAASRMDSLNDRLRKAVEALAMVSSQLGGLNAVGSSGEEARPPSSGAVSRLNESADSAHKSLSEIEGLIASIGRALG